MKMIRIQDLMFGAAVLLAPVALMAQIPAAGSSAAQNQSPAEMASLSPNDMSTNASAGVDTQLMKDRMFVHKIALGGFAESHFGQLAAQKAASDDVKKLGQKMVDDNATLYNEMKPAEDELGVRSPAKMSKEDQEEFDKLNSLSGTDFDKEYLATH
jgi:putative membrane protein